MTDDIEDIDDGIDVEPTDEADDELPGDEELDLRIAEADGPVDEVRVVLDEIESTLEDEEGEVVILGVVGAVYDPSPAADDPDSQGAVGRLGHHAIADAADDLEFAATAGVIEGFNDEVVDMALDVGLRDAIENAGGLGGLFDGML